MVQQPQKAAYAAKGNQTYFLRNKREKPQAAGVTGVEGAPSLLKRKQQQRRPEEREVIKEGLYGLVNKGRVRDGEEIGQLLNVNGSAFKNSSVK